MARLLVEHTAKGGRTGGETAGTSSSGDIALEVDLSKFATFNDLRAAVNKALLYFAGVLPP